ncbi:hypothetical protein EAO70_36450 [Streptomyces sp. adm13(2018)]|uniref:hypothetical protein n=1 Tax=Streptomyces sp. adm13(2018) TaxID=2479007 RepID=UPI0011CE5D53|nr:hypothetical protein [Streptomyces sp. adm13(2018)]TXS07013.1 hypothetical protein EAO70_36450 [Streptomyces sp. adm13(2018)]
MTQPSPADQLRAAAKVLRGKTSIGAFTATPAGAGLLRAREPIAQWLDSEASHLDHDDFPALHETALEVARAITGDTP